MTPTWPFTTTPKWRITPTSTWLSSRSASRPITAWSQRGCRPESTYSVSGPWAPTLTKPWNCQLWPAIRASKTLIGLQARGGPALLRLRELVAEGYVGEMLACNMTMFLPGLLGRGIDRAWMADRSKGANTLSIASGHALDIFCHCVGEFRELTAQVSVQLAQWPTGDGNSVSVDAADNVVVSGVLENGAAASAHIATIPWNGSGWRMEVYGTEGTLSARSEEMVQYGNVHLYGAQGAGQSLQPLEVPARLSAAPGGVPAGEPYNVAQLYRVIGDAIRDSGEAQPNFDTAVARHRLLDLLQQSSDEGRKVVLGN